MDFGWLVVLDTNENAGCESYIYPGYPVFLYSQLGTYDNTESKSIHLFISHKIKQIRLWYQL